MGDDLKDAEEVKEGVESELKKRGITGKELRGDFDLPSIHELRAVFQHLDPLRDLLTATLEGWQPPQLVVIGQESSGKSSVMERLAMMPIFPRSDGLNYCYYWVCVCVCVRMWCTRIVSTMCAYACLCIHAQEHRNAHMHT